MIDFKARRPTRFMSSPCPAIPTTSVPKMSGAMIDLIIRRNTVDSGFSFTARSGANTPIRTPTIIEIRIHDVREMRRSWRKILLMVFCCLIGCSANDRRRRLDWLRRCIASERRMAVTVQDVENEAEQEPPSEPLPRHARQSPHHADTQRRTQGRHKPYERNPERTAAFRLHMPQHQHTDANEREGEQGTDVGEVVCLTGISDERPDCYEYAGEQRRDVGRAVFPVNLARPVREQAVARLRKEYPRLAVLEHQ